MPKINLSLLIIFSLFFLIFPSPIHAFKLEGEWQTSDGLKMRAEQTGDSFAFIVTDPDIPEKYQGITSLKGTISGNQFTGEVYIIAEDCPNLNTYRSTHGLVSNTQIEITTLLYTYDLDACTRDPGEGIEDTDFYSKILSPEEQALQDYLDQSAADLTNRSGPVIDTSDTPVVSTTPVAQNEHYPVNVGADIRPDLSAIVDPFYYNPSPLAIHANPPPPSFGQDIARISDFSGKLTIHKTFNGQPLDRQPARVGSSIKSNVLHEGDTFSFQGEGFIQYHGADGSIKQFMTTGYAKTHGYADQVKTGQAGIEIVLQPAQPLPTPPPPPGPVQKFFNWLNQLLSPTPQPTPYGIVGVKG